MYRKYGTRDRWKTTRLLACCPGISIHFLASRTAYVEIAGGPLAFLFEDMTCSFLLAFVQSEWFVTDRFRSAKELKFAFSR